MPCLNRGQFIEEAIRSALLQGYPDLEFIVRDGGSTDGTLLVLTKYSRWLKFESKPDTGLYAALNDGIRSASGSIIAHLNSDDLFAPGAFTAVGDCYRRHSGLLGVIGQAATFNDADSPVLLSRFRGAEPLPDRDRIENFPAVNACFFHIEAYRRFGLYDTKFRIAADHDVLLRFGTASIPTTRLDQTLYVYRAHEHSLTLNGHDHLINILEHVELATKHLKASRGHRDQPNTVVRTWFSRIVAVHVIALLTRRRFRIAMRIAASAFVSEPLWLLWAAKHKVQKLLKGLVL